MANNEGENPFSYKTFVKKKVKPTSENPEANNEIKEMDIHVCVPQDALFPEVAVLGHQNPYSFKQFLKKQKPATPPIDRKPKLLSESDSSFSSENDDQSTEPQGILTIASLQVADKASTSTVLIDRDVSFSSCSDNDEFEHLRTSTSKLSLQQDFVNSDALEPFPDFGEITATSDEGTRLKLEIQKVKKDNFNLKKKLREQEKNLQKEEKKSKSLQNQIKSLRKKEQSETKALEDMILKVEENLTASNKRAVVAESTITKLKQEIQKLQAELAATVSSPQSVHHSYEELILGVREKANYASQQLATASYRADLQIRELCQGIEALKHVSEILYNIDNSFEVKKY